MTFEIQPANFEDMPEFVNIFQEAFAEDPNMRFMYPSTPLNVRLERSLKFHEKEFSMPGRRAFKVVDTETGKIVAISKWHFPHTPIERAEIEEPFPEGSNKALCEEFFGKLFAGRKKHIEHENMYFTSLLAVRPEYQRKGLGTMLLEPVLEQADREHRKVYIEASKKGLGLYIKHDWVQIDEMAVDTKPYGGDSVEVTVFMMREPKVLKV